MDCLDPNDRWGLSSSKLSWSLDRLYRLNLSLLTVYMAPRGSGRSWVAIPLVGVVVGRINGVLTSAAGSMGESLVRSMLARSINWASRAEVVLASSYLRSDSISYLPGHRRCCLSIGHSLCPSLFEFLLHRCQWESHLLVTKLKSLPFISSLSKALFQSGDVFVADVEKRSQVLELGVAFLHGGLDCYQLICLVSQHLALSTGSMILVDFLMKSPVTFSSCSFILAMVPSLAVTSPHCRMAPILASRWSL